MVCLFDFANHYLDFCKNQFSASTYQAKVLAFRLLFRSVPPGLLVDRLTRADVLRHFNSQFSSGRTGNAVNEDRKHLVAAWNWARRGYVTGFSATENPFCIERFREERHPRYVPSLADFWAVVAAAKTEQDRALLLTYIYTAARKGELFGLRVEDVDLERRRIRLATRKRAGGVREYDWLTIVEPLCPVLAGQIARVPGPWVFPNPRRRGNMPYTVRHDWLSVLCEAAGVRPFGVHGVRHLTATVLADQGVPMVQIQQVLRHQRLTTTERYIRSLGAPTAALATMHGFRAVFTTVANEAVKGFDKDAIERALAHRERNRVRAAYHRSEYLDERRIMLQWWGDWLEAMERSGTVEPPERYLPSDFKRS